jgi:Spy/CpxP family protein refolding chaperone
MSHKFLWRGLVAAVALFLTTPAYSQEPITVQLDNKKFAPEDNMFVFDAALPEPGLFVCVGEGGGPPVCPITPGVRPRFPFLPPGGPHFGGAKFMLPILPFANIDLTDDQVGQLAKLKRALDSFNAGAFATLYRLEDDMRDKLSSENINESDVRKLAEEIAHQKADISKHFSLHVLESAKILTPEQRKKMRLAQDRIELGPMGGFGGPPHRPIPHGRLEPGK